MSRKKKVKIFKIILLIIVLILIVALTMYLVPVMKKLSTVEGQVEFKEKISKLGIWGILILFGLQLAQIFLFILPGEPMEILAGMCYGAVGGTIFIMISVAIITALIFFLVKKVGKKFIYDFWEEKKIKKIENSKLFQNPKKIETIMIILFMIPGTPKDLLVYISGILPLKPLRIILISTFARVPSVISSTIAGANLVKGNWKVSLVVYLITFVIIGIIMFVINKLDKDKITEKALETIK